MPVHIPITKRAAIPTVPTDLANKRSPLLERMAMKTVEAVKTPFLFLGTAGLLTAIGSVVALIVLGACHGSAVQLGTAGSTLGGSVAAMVVGFGHRFFARNWSDKIEKDHPKTRDEWEFMMAIKESEGDNLSAHARTLN